MNIEEARDYIRSLPISSIVQLYIPIKQKGKNFEALCPFHSDSNPSLKISDEKQLFKCFACDTAGDSISFVQKFKSLDFIETLKELSQQLSFPLETQTKKKSDKETKTIDLLNWIGQQYYQLTQKNQIDAYNDFIQSRGIKAEIAKKFLIGYAPNESFLYNQIQNWPKDKRDIALQIAVEIGLIQKYQGRYFDTFRHRIMFPIWDRWGSIKGFGSRRLGESKMAKYINSKESYAFNKKNILYGLNFAIKSIKENDHVFLTEGYMDTIALHQANLCQTVAIMGTGMSIGAVKQLTNLTTNIYLALDSDDAGFKAAERVLPLFLEQKVIPKLLDFSPFKDPDEFLQQKGIEGFRVLKENSLDLMEFLIKKECQQATESANTDHKIAILENIFKILSPLGDHIKAYERLGKCGKDLGLTSGPDYLIRQYLSYLQKAEKTRLNPVHLNNPPTQTAGPTPSEKNQKLAQVHVKNIEPVVLQLLKEILHYPGIMLYINFDELFGKDTQTPIHNLFRFMQTLYSEVNEEEFLNLVKDTVMNDNQYEKIKDQVVSVLYENKIEPATEEQIQSICKGLKLKIQVHQKKKKRDQLFKEHQKADQQEEINRLLTEIHKINQDIFQLKKDSINGASK